MIRLSWTQLRTHEQCKMNWKLQREGRRIVTTNTRNFLPGTVTDIAVRRWLEEGEQKPGDMQKMIPEILETSIKKSQEDSVIIWRSAFDKQDVLADCIEAVTRLEPVLQRLVVPYHYQADFRFEAPLAVRRRDGALEQVMLIGALDLLVLDNQKRWWIWDVKHTKDNSYWRKTIGQLYFYDLAIELLFGRPVHREGLLQPLCTQPVKAWTSTPEARSQMLQRITSMVHDILAKEHPVNDHTKACTYCNTRLSCPKFTPVLSGGKRRMEF